MNDKWTPERRAEHRERGLADRLCREGKFTEAREHCTKYNLSWPPFRSTPTETAAPLAEVVPINKRAAAARANGKAHGGRPPGEKAFIITTPEEKEQLVEAVASTLLAGKEPIRFSEKLGPVTADDRRAITRLAGMTADEFNAQLADKLGSFADLALERMTQKLEQDLFKPNELSFALAIALDKRNNLEGRNALQNANIAIQVNNYNSPKKSREDMIKSLTGEIDAT